MMTTIRRLGLTLAVLFSSFVFLPQPAAQAADSHMCSRFAYYDLRDGDPVQFVDGGIPYGTPHARFTVMFSTNSSRTLVRLYKINVEAVRHGYGRSFLNPALTGAPLKFRWNGGAIAWSDPTFRTYLNAPYHEVEYDWHNTPEANRPLITSGAAFVNLVEPTVQWGNGEDDQVKTYWQIGLSAAYDSCSLR